MRRHYYPPRCGIGIVEIGEFMAHNKNPLYVRWSSMLRRVTQPQGQYVSYAETKIDPRFIAFQEFCKWAVSQIGFDKAGWHMDKDLLSSGKHIYGPDHCVFIPSELNQLLAFAKREPKVHVSAAGIYSVLINSKHYENGYKRLGPFQSRDSAVVAHRREKQRLITSVANKYRDELDPRAYNASLTFYGVEKDN
jgi:hypothetical protein